MRHLLLLSLLFILLITPGQAYALYITGSDVEQLPLNALSEAATDGNWDIANAQYSDKWVRTSSNVSNGRSIDFKSDGSKMYIVGRSTENIAEYDLSTPWNISTAIFLREFDISGEMGSTSQGSNAHGLFFNKDNGTDMYVWNRTEIWQYELSEPWNVETAQQIKYKDLSHESRRGHDIDFKPDGTKFYVEDRNNQAVYQYSLSVPWDIETLNLDYTLDISDLENEVRGIELKPDGTRMYLMDTGRREILQYELHVPWEIESSSFITAFDVSDQSDNPRSVTWKPDGTSFYITHTSNSTVYQYRVALVDDDEEPAGPEAPQPLLPTNNSVDISLTPVFEWSSVDADYYILYASLLNTTEIVVETEVTGTSFVPDGELGPQKLYQWRVMAVKGDLKSEWSPFWEFTTESNDNEEEDIQEVVISLNQNFPNPFNPSTQIRFTIGETQNVMLKVTDMVGRHVSTLIDGRLAAGTHQTTFSADHLASGIYFYRLITENEIITRQMTLMK